MRHICFSIGLFSSASLAAVLLISCGGGTPTKSTDCTPGDGVSHDPISTVPMNPAMAQGEPASDSNPTAVKGTEAYGYINSDKATTVDKASDCACIHYGDIIVIDGHLNDENGTWYAQLMVNRETTTCGHQATPDVNFDRSFFQFEESDAKFCGRFGDYLFFESRSPIVTNNNLAIYSISAKNVVGRIPVFSAGGHIPIVLPSEKGLVHYIRMGNAYAQSHELCESVINPVSELSLPNCMDEFRLKNQDEMELLPQSQYGEMRDDLASEASPGDLLPNYGIKLYRFGAKSDLYIGFTQ